jgi:hypothetical protein
LYLRVKIAPAMGRRLSQANRTGATFVCSGAAGAWCGSRPVNHTGHQGSFAEEDQGFSGRIPRLIRR